MIETAGMVVGDSETNRRNHAAREVCFMSQVQQELYRAAIEGVFTQKARRLTNDADVHRAAFRAAQEVSVALESFPTDMVPSDRGDLFEECTSAILTAVMSHDGSLRNIEGIGNRVVREAIQAVTVFTSHAVAQPSERFPEPPPALAQEPSADADTDTPATVAEPGKDPGDDTDTPATVAEPGKDPGDGTQDQGIVDKPESGNNTSPPR